MHALPYEILLKIGLDNEDTYRASLAIPKFARILSAGIRLIAMEKFGYYCKMKSSMGGDKCLTWHMKYDQHIGGNIPTISTTTKRKYLHGVMQYIHGYGKCYYYEDYARIYRICLPDISIVYSQNTFLDRTRRLISPKRSDSITSSNCGSRWWNHRHSLPLIIPYKQGIYQ